MDGFCKGKSLFKWMILTGCPYFRTPPFFPTGNLTYLDGVPIFLLVISLHPHSIPPRILSPSNLYPQLSHQIADYIILSHTISYYITPHYTISYYIVLSHHLYVHIYSRFYPHHFPIFPGVFCVPSEFSASSSRRVRPKEGLQQRRTQFRSNTAALCDLAFGMVSEWLVINDGVSIQSFGDFSAAQNYDGLLNHGKS